jgi:16S rRNA C967 or C1407 C5-methylase (RsmB/RsmF family)
MKPPSLRYLKKVAAQLFTSEGEKRRFIELFDSYTHPPLRAFIWMQRPLFGDLHPLFPDFVTVADRSLNDPSSTDYYMLDLSSVFECLPFGALAVINSAIDLCAAPGGKSIFAYQALKPGRFVANEVIRKRCRSLRDNLIRLGLASVELTSLPVEQLSCAYPEEFDLAIVDAPCSGQSLILKAIENPGAFNPRTIEHNAMRQRRILANAAKTVRPEGYLAYMTCTFSPAENEEVVSWFLAAFPEFNSVNCEHLFQFQSKLSQHHCYRVFPWDNLGAGGFSCLMRKN